MVVFEDIELLNSTDCVVASEIYFLFQESYRKEAELLSVVKFPPLERSVTAIRESASSFWGKKTALGLAGVIEVQEADTVLRVLSLAVSPDFFRHGVGSGLLNFVIATWKGKNLEVTTAIGNAPAIGLYHKFGFTEVKCWSSAEGIALVQLERRHHR
ncbi:MAG: GNAT family N-acetyltransferase [Gammaproteobacteria bacterium]|nr:GNAT family N-acetyltransferase [Pseudomonadales bacterium]MCP5347715.1 GNAT family N-acetyltransferase [Pseudomonadales bacterium]